MAHTGNGQSLLGGCGGEQSAGAAKENALELAFIEFSQQISAEGDGTASAARTA